MASPHTRGPVQHLPPAPHRRAEAAAGRRRWGPAPLPRGALSSPCRTARGRGSQASGRAVPAGIGREAAPGRCFPYLDGLFSQPPALCKRPPAHLRLSPQLHSPLNKGCGPPRSGLRTEYPPLWAPSLRPLGAPLARPSSAFVPCAALRAAGGQRRGPGPRTKKAAGPGRRPLSAPPLASPAGAAAPRTKGQGGGGGAACPRPDKARGPDPGPKKGRGCERGSQVGPCRAHPPVRWP